MTASTTAFLMAMLVTVAPVMASASTHWLSTMRCGIFSIACSPTTRLSLWLRTATEAIAPPSMTVFTSMGPCMLVPCVM